MQSHYYTTSSFAAANVGSPLEDDAGAFQALLVGGGVIVKF